MNKASDKIYFQHLDVVRFLAAFMIVILHAYEAWVGWFGELGMLTGGTYHELSFFGKYIDRFIRNLGMGVDIFFLLSGFLITYILIEEKKRYNKIAITKFIIRRTLRIWPLYFILVAAAPFIISWVDSGDSPNYLYNILFLNNFEGIITQKWTYPFAHFWSICIEEHFYLVWPFIIAFIPNKRLLPVFASLIAMSILFRLYSSITMDYPWYTLYLHTLSRIDVLVIGAIGAYFYSEKPFEIKLNRMIRYILYILLIVSLCIEAVELWDTHFLAAFKKFFYIGIISVLLLDYNFNPKFIHLLPKKSVFHYLGKVSYGIYMYSNILVLIIIKKFMWTFDSKNLWLFILLNVSLSIIIPILSYELLEKHILKLNSRFRVIKTDR